MVAAKCRKSSEAREHFRLFSRGLSGGFTVTTDHARPSYPAVLDPELVGTYEAAAKSGGGLVWDEVLEYRVWCHPELGAPDVADGSDYYYAFATYEEAEKFAEAAPGAEEPLALVLQREHINEPSPGQYEHVAEERVTEWPVAFLFRPRRTARTIPDFLAPDAPADRLEILRGNVARY